MTSVSKRKLEDYMVPKQANDTSPAMYSPKSFNKNAAYQNVKPAPFNSLEQKWSPEKQAIKKNIPGPGAYNVSGNLNKGKVIAVDGTPGTYYIQDNHQNKAKTIGRQAIPDKINLWPGPGAYEQESHFDKMIQHEKLRRRKQGSHSVKPSMTNIVSSSNSTLYAKDMQTSDSTLLDGTYKGPVLENSSTTASRQVMKINTSRGTINTNKDGNMFGKSERKLAIEYSNTSTKIGPGSYANSVYSIAPYNLDTTAMNRSNVFTEHSTFGKSDRKLHPQTEKARRRHFSSKFVENMRQGRKRVSSINQNFDDSSDSDIDNTAPGPGSYYNPLDVNDTNLTELQYFGSTSPRFATSDKNKFPGPGQYDGKIEIPKKGIKESSVFRKERKIETIFQKFIPPGPGPGKYKDNRTEFRSKKRYKHRKGSKFISAERRFFYEPEYIRNPGPGKYFAEKNPIAINGAKEKFQYDFGSKGNRKIEDFMNIKNSPVYNLQDFNAISGQKTVTRAPNNFTIMYKKEAPFLTSSPRFKEGETSEEQAQSAAAMNDHRKYDKKNSLLNKLINEALRQRIPRMPFNASDERFKEKTSSGPGPGQYAKSKDRWNKQTFNLRFIK